MGPHLSPEASASQLKMPQMLQKRHVQEHMVAMSQRAPPGGSEGWAKKHRWYGFFRRSIISALRPCMRIDNLQPHIWVAWEDFAPLFAAGNDSKTVLLAPLRGTGQQKCQVKSAKVSLSFKYHYNLIAKL